MEELSWRKRGQLWLRLGLRLVILLLALWAIAALGPGFLSLFAPFILAGFCAAGMAPAVRWFHKKLGLPRKFLTLALLLLVLGGLGGIIWGLCSVGMRELVSLAGNWEGMVASLQGMVNTLSTTFARAMDHLPVSAQQTADSLMNQLFDWLETVFPRFLSAAVDWAKNVAMGLPSFAVALVVFVMACYFLTADYPHLRASFADRLPEGPRFFLSLVKKAASAGFGGYLKAQLIMSAVVFFILLAGFLLIRQPYALLLALALAVLDFIPILGSGTAMVPWAVIDLFTGQLRHGVGLMVVWGVVALFRQVAEPKILGGQTGLPPILSLISVYVGMRLAGVPGMILGPVLCLVVLNVCRSGILDPALADVKLAVSDLGAILKGGEQVSEGVWTEARAREGPQGPDTSPSRREDN